MSFGYFNVASNSTRTLCLAKRDRLANSSNAWMAEKDMATNRVQINKDTEIYERQARICKAFAHPGRLQVLDLLGRGERGVSELQEALGISKTSMSQHLSVLKSAGVMATRREGKQIYCSLAMPEVKQACQLIRKVLQAQIAVSQRLVA
jgi:DNA-binding transcriptional ArsR family regulator